jgi:hypothetical protein
VQCKRCAKIDRKHGCPQSLHLTTRQKRTLFLQATKKTGKFEWTEEAKEAFESLKMYLNSSPILTPPEKNKDMMLYILATSTVVSVAIVVERRRARIQSTAASILHQ